jgi:biopolymer transport protein ExbD
MAINWKVIVPIGIFVLLVAVMITVRLGDEPQKLAQPTPATTQDPATTKSPVAPVTQMPAATNNVDDVVEALFTDSSEEISQITQTMDDDVVLVGIDSQTISDLGQSYDENDF